MFMQTLSSLHIEVAEQAIEQPLQHFGYVEPSNLAYSLAGRFQDESLFIPLVQFIRAASPICVSIKEDCVDRFIHPLLDRVA